MELCDMFSLKGRRALVTGSSRGIGRGIALALAKAGAAVAVHGVKPGPMLDSAAEEITALGAEAFKATGDLASSQEVAALIQSCRKSFGAPDILVLNASVQRYMPLEEFDADEFAREYAANLKSTIELVKAFTPDMKAKKWGRVLAIGSVNQWKQSPRLPVYASTKSAQANFMVSCARQLSKFGITANNLAPGVIVTDRNREALSDQEFSDKVLSGIPAGRFGQPADCAGLALLLCSDAGAYITGEDIAVDGGMRL